MKRAIVWLRRLFHRDSAWQEEIESHLAMRADWHQAQGVAPDAARTRAAREFGSPLRALEAVRAVHRAPWLDALAQDAHHGLRVIRQQPWECLASFIASSSKQIVQIRQIVRLLAQRFGEPIDADHHAFPTVSAIARASHQQLWDCKLGFRAKNLLAAARMIDSGQLDLHALRTMEYDRALEELIKLPGVGEKIANCVLLFACGFDHAFPIDVWIERALRRIYFPGKKRVTARELRQFARSHFGPYAGWAQQYLFYNERSIVGRASRPPS